MVRKVPIAVLLIPLLIGLACLSSAALQTEPGSPSTPSPGIEPSATALPSPEEQRGPAPIPTPQKTPLLTAYPAPVKTAEEPRQKSGSRGYLTTPEELQAIAAKAHAGIEPYASAVAEVLEYSNSPWDYPLQPHTSCPSADEPAWIDDQKGIPRLYARALAYHLTGDEKYAAEVKDILARIMVEVETISLAQQQCRLNFSWGTPELVASADLLESYWRGQECEGPASTRYGDRTLTVSSCKRLFQNWLVKNPYYLVSYSAERSQSNWGAAATNTTAYIADYLWDRGDVQLMARTGRQKQGEVEIAMSPWEAYSYASRLALDRMNGLRVELDSSYSCDYLSGKQQDKGSPPVKSQITEMGIIPEDARRDEFCNIRIYDSAYQNYPQVHLGNNIQQCELMLRRGDPSCYENVSQTEIINYQFTGPDGKARVTNLYPGRGSIERAIKAIIVDSGMEWRKDSALEVAYRYYFKQHTLPGFEQWFAQLDRPSRCSQDICFGTLTHGFAAGEIPQDAPVVSPPQGLD